MSAIMLLISLSSLTGCTPDKHESSGALYKSDAFTLYADSVVYGTSAAYAPDDSTLVSTFLSPDAKADTLHIRHSTMSLRYNSEANIVDAVHNMSLSCLDTIPGNLTTAEVAYLTDLALCYVDPDRAKQLLRSKVRDGVVVQGSSYGGGFPVATDAVAWIAAAWQVYEVTGDHSWIEEVYPVVCTMLDIYETVVADSSTGLFRGMQSVIGNIVFPYPDWMTPADVAGVETITVNALTARAYEGAAMMAMALGHDGKEYMARHNQLVEAINTTLWMPNVNMYSMYAYLSPFPIAAGAVDNLGQGLSMVYNIATPEMSRAIQSHTPILPLGIPAMYPTLPDSLDTKSDAIVPAIEAYWTIAASNSGNATLLRRLVGSLTCLSAINLGVYPYLDSSTGTPQSGSYSSRSPLSAAANLAAIYRGMLGLRFTQGGIELHPSIPQSVNTRREVRNLRYRDAMLHIIINGYGSVISSYKMDGAEQTSHAIPPNIKGTHVIEITMGGNSPKGRETNDATTAMMPPTPDVDTWTSHKILIKRFVTGDAYEVYLNGVFEEQIFTDTYKMYADVKQFTSVAFVPVRGEQYIGFSSQPLYFYPQGSVITVPADSLAYTGTSLIADRHVARQFVETTESYRSKMSFSIDAPADGEYLMESIYSNALADGTSRSGLCAIRLVSVNDSIAGALVMPPTVKDEWTLTSRSNLLRIHLNKGENRISIIYRKPYTVNGHRTLNNALIRTIRFYRL